MKLLLISVATALVGITPACLMSRESSFFTRFSMQDLIRSNRSFPGFGCDPLGGGGTGGSGGIRSLSGGFFGKTHFQSNKADAFACRLRSNELASADEERLIGSLRQQVEDSLHTYGAAIKDSGNPDRRSFYFLYAINDIQGKVRISGQRAGVDYYSLNAELEESNN